MICNKCNIQMDICGKADMALPEVGGIIHETYFCCKKCGDAIIRRKYENSKICKFDTYYIRLVVYEKINNMTTMKTNKYYYLMTRGPNLELVKEHAINYIKTLYKDIALDEKSIRNNMTVLTYAHWPDDIKAINDPDLWFREGKWI